jgi:hypothetical protein
MTRLDRRHDRHTLGREPSLAPRGLGLTPDAQFEG